MGGYAPEKSRPRTLFSQLGGNGPVKGLFRVFITHFSSNFH